MAFKQDEAVVVEDPEGLRLQDFFFLELDGERVMMILTECPVEEADAWRPWFLGRTVSPWRILPRRGPRPRPT